MKKIPAVILAILSSAFSFQISITGPEKAYHIGQLHGEIVVQTNLTNAFLTGISHNLPAEFKFDFISNLTLDQTNALYLALSNHTVAPATVNVPYLLDVSGTDNFVNGLSLGTFYQMANGIWRMKFTIMGTSSTDEHIVITISNIVFHPVFTNSQSVSLTTRNIGQGTQAWVNPDASTLEGTTCDLLSVGSDVWSWSGDVALKYKPAVIP